MSEKARILIVDDEKHIRDSVSELLIDNGYSAGAAASGEEALTKLNDESFDIVLLDAKMAKMSGIQLLEKIKTDHPGVDIIMITGYGTVNMAVESLKLGAYDFLQKPCDNNEIQASIKRLLEKRRLEDELKEVRYYHELILQSAGEGIIGIDREGKQIFVNPAAAKKLGYEVVELIGQPSHTMWHHSKPDGTPYPKGECPIDAAYTDGTIYTRDEEVFWRKDGTSFPVRYTSTPIWEDDKLLGAVIIFRDITDRKKSEEALRKSEGLYKSLVETTDTGYVIIDHEGKVLDANQEYVRLSGHKNIDEIRGRSVIEWTAAYEQEKNAMAIAKCARDGFIRNLEIDYVNGQGKVTPIEINATVVEKDGMPRILTLCRDITERKQAEAVRKESEQNFKAIFDNAGDGIVTADVATQKFYLANEMFCKMTGYRQDEIKTLGVMDIHPEKDMPYVLEQFGRLAELKSRTVNNIPVKRKGGSIFYVDVCAVHITLSGKTYLLGIFRDITERKKFEEEIVIRNKIANIFLTSTTDEDMYNEALKVVLKVMESKYGIIGYIDENGAHIVPSMSRDIWDKCQVPDKTFIFPRDKWGDSSWPRAYREKKSNYTNEPSTITPEGHISISRHISTPILFQGEAIGLIQVANKETDYTEKDVQLLELIGNNIIAPILSARLLRNREENARKQAEDKLKKYSEKLEEMVEEQTRKLLESHAVLIHTGKMVGLGILTGGIAHEVNNPLASILTYAQLILSKSEKGALSLDTAVDYAGRIEEVAKHCKSTIQNLLDFSREPEGKANFFSVKEAILASVSLLAHQMNLQGITVVNDAEDATIFSYRSHLMQVFVDVLTNAKDAMPDGGEIRIATGLEDDCVNISISDTGTGIRQEDMDKIFDPFFTTKEPGWGTGLGLYLCYRIMQNLSGKIDVKSVVDKGTTVTIKLPITKEFISKTTPPSPLPSPARGEGSKSPLERGAGVCSPPLTGGD